MRRSVCVVLLLSVAWSSAQLEHVPDDDFINQINEAQDSWVAGRNFYPGSSTKNLFSALPVRNETLHLRVVKVRQKIPQSFDGRINWKRCRALGSVKEQGNCASAWALVATGVFSDRQCIARVGVGELSSQSVLACCKACGVGCLGGYLTDALTFLVRRGAPTKKCNPNDMYPCPKQSKMLNCAHIRAINPGCPGFCRTNYPLRQPYMDMHRSSHAYSIANSSDAIRHEIMTRGPVAALIDVYQDFLAYKSGVYFRTGGRLVTQHPVKVVGWGDDGDSPYWIVLNSWGSSWGDKGVIRIARHSNGINLENRVFAVLGDDAPVPNAI